MDEASISNLSRIWQCQTILKVFSHFSKRMRRSHVSKASKIPHTRYGEHSYVVRFLRLVVLEKTNLIFQHGNLSTKLKAPLRRDFNFSLLELSVQWKYCVFSPWWTVFSPAFGKGLAHYYSRLCTKLRNIINTVFYQNRDFLFIYFNYEIVLFISILVIISSRFLESTNIFHPCK